MIKFFADTAVLEEIEQCFSKGVDDGVTTNPMIMKNAGVTDFAQACRDLVSRYPRVPISLETDLQGIPVSELDKRVPEVKRVLLDQARRIADYGSNTVVKIPICHGGLEAVSELTPQGIRTNVTACMTPYQALAAAKAGATYVSLFANRMLDTHTFTLASGRPFSDIGTPGLDWKKVVADGRAEHGEHAWQTVMSQIGYVADQLRADHPETELIVGSIRSPGDIERLVYAEPHIITIPFGIVTQLREIPALKHVRKPSTYLGHIIYGDSIRHPVTSLTLEEFERAADSYRKLTN